MTEVRVGGIAIEVGGVRLVRDGALHAPSGSTIALVGPNGCGKTSLLRAVYRSLRPVAGQVLVDGREVWDMSARDAALRTAVVMQDDLPEFDFTVAETVALGRVPHLRLLDRAGVADRHAVEDAMATAGVTPLAARVVRTLSGGERQRVHLARALAQQTPVLVLDEPTNHLDVGAQLALLELLTSVPLTVVTALHDLNLAAAYCDRVFVMQAGSVIAHGPPSETLTPHLLREVFGIRAHCLTNPLTGRSALLYGPADDPALKETSCSSAARHPARSRSPRSSAS